MLATSMVSGVARCVLFTMVCVGVFAVAKPILVTIAIILYGVAEASYLDLKLRAMRSYMARRQRG